jgi:hypothetical protein
MAMDRKTACLVQASACREKAEADPANRDYWIDQSIKWLERAISPADGVAISYETKDGNALRKDQAGLIGDGQPALKHHSDPTRLSDPS